jgi:hypothetical protein
MTQSEGEGIEKRLFLKQKGYTTTDGGNNKLGSC